MSAQPIFKGPRQGVRVGPQLYPRRGLRLGAQLGPAQGPRMVTVDEPTLYRMAQTRDYMAELDTGQIVDLHDYVMSCYEPGNMSGFFKKIFKKIKRAFKKPLTRILPYVGLAVGITGAIAPAALGAKLATSPIVAGLAKANKVIELTGMVRDYVQAGGIEPTEGEVNETVNQIMQRYPSIYTPTPTVAAPVPAPIPPSPWAKYEPYIPYAFGLLALTVIASALKR